ncbi:hypothetical protein F0562_018620 [Nyssa sinensis]|uniref:Uncharacterized protein n=1 Tax=Nyssa sinensis TaxID=561372 RepID=A0A5J4ZCX1_9ASTE|nr:hypothetical protein F0562_018620 [Nyssa sinensis]
MSSSSPEANGLAAETLGSTVKVEFGEATAVPHMSNAQSVCQLIPLTYGQSLVHVSTTLSEVSNARVTNEHSTISMLNPDDEKFMMDNLYQISGPPKFKKPGLCLQDHDYIGKIKELQVYVDKVKKIVKPGCSQEVLEVALSSMSSLVETLSVLSSRQKPQSSL